MRDSLTALGCRWTTGPVQALDMVNRLVGMNFLRSHAGGMQDKVIGGSRAPKMNFRGGIGGKNDS